MYLKYILFILGVFMFSLVSADIGYVEKGWTLEKNTELMFKEPSENVKANDFIRLEPKQDFIEDLSDYEKASYFDKEEKEELIKSKYQLSKEQFDNIKTYPWTLYRKVYWKEPYDYSAEEPWDLVEVRSGTIDASRISSFKPEFDENYVLKIGYNSITYSAASGYILIDGNYSDWNCTESIYQADLADDSWNKTEKIDNWTYYFNGTDEDRIWIRIEPDTQCYDRNIHLIFNTPWRINGQSLYTIRGSGSELQWGMADDLNLSTTNYRTKEGVSATILTNITGGTLNVFKIDYAGGTLNLFSSYIHVITTPPLDWDESLGTNCPFGKNADDGNIWNTNMEHCRLNHFGGSMVNIGLTRSGSYGLLNSNGYVEDVKMFAVTRQPFYVSRYYGFNASDITITDFPYDLFRSYKLSGNAECIDCVSPEWTIAWIPADAPHPDGKIFRKYTFHPIIQNEENTTLSNCNVSMWDNEGVYLFSENTTTNGTLENEQVVTMGFYNVTGDDTIYSKTPHRLVVDCGDDYQTLNTTMVIDHEIEDEFVMHDYPIIINGFIEFFNDNVRIISCLGLILIPVSYLTLRRRLK